MCSKDVEDHDINVTEWVTLVHKGQEDITSCVRELHPKQKPQGRTSCTAYKQSNDLISEDRIIVENYLGHDTHLSNVRPEK